MIGVNAMRWKFRRDKGVDDGSPRSEAETLDRIEAVTTRLEWLAEEIETQLLAAREGDHGE